MRTGSEEWSCKIAGVSVSDVSLREESISLASELRRPLLEPCEAEDKGKCC